MLVDELAETEAIAAAGARVRLKYDADREARAAREERLPTGLQALTTAFFIARDRGLHALTLFLPGRGLTLTRRPPFGAGSKERLLFRRHRAEALNWVGRNKDALDEAEPLGADFARALGDRAPETFYTRPSHRAVPEGYRRRGRSPRRGRGAPAALHRGPGRAAFLRAGDAHSVGGLPPGRRRSGGAAAEIEGVREGLAAAGLRPEHRFSRRLEEVEERLRGGGEG